jgi:hypothetical protein
MNCDKPPDERIPRSDMNSRSVLNAFATYIIRKKEVANAKASVKYVALLPRLSSRPCEVSLKYY